MVCVFPQRTREVVDPYLSPGSSRISSISSVSRSKHRGQCFCHSKLTQTPTWCPFVRVLVVLRWGGLTTVVFLWGQSEGASG